MIKIVVKATRKCRLAETLNNRDRDTEKTRDEYLVAKKTTTVLAMRRSNRVGLSHHQGAAPSHYICNILVGLFY